MTAPLRIGLVGLGKIARDQHLPAIAQNTGATLVAVASRNAAAPGIANYHDLDALLAGEPTLDALVLCQPPQIRCAAARRALLAGKHVFLEKPPGATVAEVEALAELADAQHLSLFASWHSRFAAAVEPARLWLEHKSLRRVTVTWTEDVRAWHPGQSWIWQRGGFGVFDPGINALSILTKIVSDTILVREAVLEIPTNRDTPIAARLGLETASGVPIAADFDWRHQGSPKWNIAIDTEQGDLLLSHGGNRLTLNGTLQDAAPEREYASMYRHFVELVRTGRSDVDLRPLRLVSDAYLCGSHTATDPFEDS